MLVQAQTEQTLKPVEVRDTREPEGKDTLKSQSTGSAKGNQAVRDIPQSITTVTEKLIDDRNLDTLKEVLHNTAGVTFLAAEGGEEDVRLRGFSLAATGDIFLDGMRDPAFYERDTFNLDKVDLLRGSASMLFGRGSTGGAVNQVTKQAQPFDDREVSLTLGSYQYRRLVGDLNLKISDSSAIRLGAMTTTADNDGRGNGVEKHGLSIAGKSTINREHEVFGTIFWLENKSPRMNYGLPWVTGSLIPNTRASDYFGMDSDYNKSSASIFTLGHVWRLGKNDTLTTKIRHGSYERDQRASALRFADAATTNLSNISSATRLTRGTNLKVQDMQTTQVQSDLSMEFMTGTLKHQVIAGVEYVLEKKQVFGARSAAQGGVTLTKPIITLGGTVAVTNNSVGESSRSFFNASSFEAKGASLFAQDTLHLSKQWKLVGGLRFDKLDGDFKLNSLPANAPSPLTTTAYSQKISELSSRFGALFQPNEQQSYHVSYGTSFNTSGDTYSYNSTSANTAPEKSRNIEIGAKIDSANKYWSSRFALFHAEKYNERNTDVDSAATSLLLSGKRHSTGLELDLSGKLTKDWEVFGSYMVIPNAKVDRAAACPAAPAQCLQSQPGERVGERPGLVPKHSGTIWTTYQLTPKWRIGSGINFRSSQTPVQSSIQAPGYAAVDLMAEYRFNDYITMKLNVNNVHDKYYADTLYRGHYVPGQGRVVMLNLTARY